MKKEIKSQWFWHQICQNWSSIDNSIPPQRWKVPISIVAVNRFDHTDWLDIMVDDSKHLSPRVLISLRNPILLISQCMIVNRWLGTGAKYGRSFGLTTCGWPQLKLILLLLFYDLELRPISGAGRRKLQPNLAPTPYRHTSFSYVNRPIWIDIIMNPHSCIKHTNKKTSLIYCYFHHVERARTFLYLTPLWKS